MRQARELAVALALRASWLLLQEAGVTLAGGQPGCGEAGWAEGGCLAGPLLTAQAVVANEEEASMLQTRLGETAVSNASGWLSSSSSSSSGSYRVRFVRNDEVEKVLPSAPASYPKPLRGVLWLDQRGVYGFSNQTSQTTFADLCVTFGDTSFSTLDATTHKVQVRVYGPAWTWFNSAEGYTSWLGSKLVGWTYEFQFNEKYDFARVNLIWSPLGLFDYRFDTGSLNATMVLQTPPAGACPPKAGASKQDISICAKWRRETHNLDGSLSIYYAWEIVDENGNRVQPYYDRYLAFANSVSKPDGFLSHLLFKAMGETKDSQISGV